MVTAVDFSIISDLETIGWSILVIYLDPFSAEIQPTTGKCFLGNAGEVSVQVF